MRARAVWMLVALATSCGDRGPRRRESAPRDAATAPDARRVHGEADVALARYHSIDEIVAAGGRARDQLAVVRVARAEIRRDDVTAYPCERGDGPRHRFFLMYSTDHVDHVRAMPELPEGACPRVLMKVRSIGSTGYGGYRTDHGRWEEHVDASMNVVADVLAILDVTPRPPHPAPPGMDYATLVDVQLGREDGGALAQVALRRPSGPPPLFTVLIPCDPHDRADGVLFRDEDGGGPLATLAGCHLVTFRTRPRPAVDHGKSIEAELVEVGPRLEPAP